MPPHFNLGAATFDLEDIEKLRHLFIQLVDDEKYVLQQSDRYAVAEHLLKLAGSLTDGSELSFEGA
jgi:hypothetical protein